MLSRGEFGILGMERILDLLGAHGISGSFFIPGHTIDTFPDICRRTHAEGHEIAHHGWTHRRPDDIYNHGGVDAERQELLRGIESIRRITGAPPTGYRSPAWDLSPATLRLLIEHGFSYDSSLMATDYTPYWTRDDPIPDQMEPAKFGASTSLVEMPISWSLDDYPAFEFGATPSLMSYKVLMIGAKLQMYS